jgi:hypothetical protein
MCAYVVAMALASGSCEYDVSGWGRDGVHPARVSGDLAGVLCLLDASTARVHVDFGYRACFSGSDNDLDLALSQVGVLSGRLDDRGASGIWQIGPTMMTRDDGREHLHLLITALQRDDEGTSEEETTRVFARITYWCDDGPTRAIALSTNRLSPTMKQYLEQMRPRSRAEVPSQHPYYSRVHGFIEVLDTILAYGARESASGFDTSKTLVGGICEANAGTAGREW